MKRKTVFRQLMLAAVFFGTLWVGQEADLQTLRLMTFLLAFALTALLAVYWTFLDKRSTSGNSN